MRACQFFLLHLFFQSFQLELFSLKQELFTPLGCFFPTVHMAPSFAPIPCCPRAASLPKKGQCSHGGCGALSLCSLHHHAKCLLLFGFCSASTALKTSDKHSSYKHNLFCGPWDNTVLWGDVQTSWVFILQHWLPSMVPLPSFLKGSV